jgi:hypothetical protein
VVKGKRAAGEIGCLDEGLDRPGLDQPQQLGGIAVAEESPVAADEQARVDRDAAVRGQGLEHRPLLGTQGVNARASDGWRRLAGSKGSHEGLSGSGLATGGHR